MEEQIDQCAKQLASRIVDAVRNNPQLWGKASMENAIQDGQVKFTEITIRETLRFTQPRSNA